MSQYKTGTATVTNNSPTVTGTNTLWLANVTAGDSFTVAGDGVMYDVASVDSDTQVTLSVAYAGPTAAGAAGAVYTIARDFTSPDDFPELTTGDIETPTIITRALRKIQGKFTGIAINTTAEIGQAVNDHVALPDPHSQYAELSGGASANFTSMPQVGGDPIVESGSNANGDYVKYADGTQICWIKKFRLDTFNNPDIRNIWSFPSNFASGSNPVCTGAMTRSLAAETSIGNGDLSYLRIANADETTLVALIYPITGLTFTSGDAISIDIMGIGRWS